MDTFVMFLTVFGYISLLFCFFSFVYLVYKLIKFKRESKQVSDSLSDFCDKIRLDMEHYNDNNNNNND